MSEDEIQEAVDCMSDHQKYHLLTSHSKPDSSYTFPSSHLNKCNRAFKYNNWTRKYPWLTYSMHLDGVFCLHCALFSRERSGRGSLVNRPFVNWTRCSEAFRDHAASKYHVSCISASEMFAAVTTGQQRTVDRFIDRQKDELANKNKNILLSIIDAILFCGRQCIALRGDNEHLNTPGNPGNFLAILRLIGQSNNQLMCHLNAPVAKNATYVSPMIQNELIGIVGDMIQRKLVEDIVASEYFSILADEVTSHNKEQLSLCIRFVDTQTCTIREEFLTFLPLVRTTGEVIAHTILNALSDLGLQKENMRGQGYDGAAAMSSSRCGVQGRIRKEAPLAFYTHCFSHSLNLVIVHSCALVDVRNVLDKLKETSLFFNASPKRESLLINVVEVSVPFSTSHRKPILDLCKTRWAERHEAYQHFYQAHTHVIKSLEIIAHGIHQDEGFDPLLASAVWDKDSKSRASSLLHALCDFGFLVTFVVIYKLLSRLSGITKMLQKEALDIIAAMNLIEEVKSEYKHIRSNIDDFFDTSFDHAVRMADALGVEPSMPRVARKQMHRANATSDGPRQYYHRNIAVPFLDHIISELDTQFSEASRTAVKLLALVPNVINGYEYNDLQPLVDMYVDDLPSPAVLPEEFMAWKNKCTGSTVKTCADALKMCNKMLYPNVHKLLTIACVLPVTSCTCERSFSALRRLNTYMRSSMGQERLTGLALMHIHYDHPISAAEVLRSFVLKNPRRIYLGNCVN